MVAHRPRDSGFTLIEVLIAVLLLASTAAGIFHVVIIVLASTRDAREQSEATLLAMQKLEELKGAAWGSAALVESSGEPLAADVAGFSDHVGSYVRRWSIRPVTAGPAGVLLRVLVTPIRRAMHVDVSSGAGEGVVVLTTLRTMW